MTQHGGYLGGQNEVLLLGGGGLSIGGKGLIPIGPRAGLL